MIVASWGLVVDFRRSAVTPFSPLSLSQHFKCCEICMRTSSPVTLPKRSTEETYRVQILEVPPNELPTWFPALRHTYIKWKNLLFYTSGFEVNQPLSDRCAAQSEWMHWIPLQNGTNFQTSWKRLICLQFKNSRHLQHRSQSHDKPQTLP